MHQVVIPLERRGFGQTMRKDAWWSQSLLTFVILGAFVVYATWAAFQGEHYEFGPYLSPFYSPLIFGSGPHSWFGPKPGWWPEALPFSAALLILWAPGGFRWVLVLPRMVGRGGLVVSGSPCRCASRSAGGVRGRRRGRRPGWGVCGRGGGA